MGKDKRRKQQRNEEEEEPPSTRDPLPPSSTPSASELLRNWAELPEIALHDILTRLLTSNPDLPDFLSFSSVCRSWRSTSPTSPTSFPPLLLLPVLLSPENPNHLPRWSRPPRCRLQTLLTQRTFQSKVPPEILTLTRLGYSNGRLIFLSSSRSPLLADVFTGELTRIRPPPERDFPLGSLIALLADRNFFLLTSESRLLSYRPGTDSWSSLAIPDPSLDIVSLAFHLGKIFALDSMSRLMVVDLGGEKDELFIGGWKLMEVEAPVQPGLPAILNATVHHRVTFHHRLVECGGELLLLRFNRFVRCMITVYRLDFERLMWVRKEKLGDWCIFLDNVGHRPIMCPNPARWGGRRNCIYFAGLEPGNWAMIPLNEDIITDTGKSLLEHVFGPASRGWLPTPLWVYPN